jgi:hypothetical protein
MCRSLPKAVARPEGLSYIYPAQYVIGFIPRQAAPGQELLQIVPLRGVRMLLSFIPFAGKCIDKHSLFLL